MLLARTELIAQCASVFVGTGGGMRRFDRRARVSPALQSHCWQLSPAEPLPPTDLITRCAGLFIDRANEMEPFRT